MNYEYLFQKWLSKQHCGYWRVPMDALIKNQTGEVDPLLIEILRTCPVNPYDYIVDVKVHMLMPNQYPCIPNWHCDNIPRDENNNLELDEIDTTQKMYLWLSNEPFTEFADGRKVEPMQWVEFTQMDKHRGVMSDKHIWRMFIRATPRNLLDETVEQYWIRRHCQVYLDSDNFTW